MLQVGVQTQTRQIGTACRIYKNADDTVLAIDDIAVIENTRHAKNNKMLRTAHKTFSRTYLHLGGSRVISTVQMIGDYTSISGDLNDLTWAPGGDNSNDVEITLNDLPQIGDTI